MRDNIILSILLYYIKLIFIGHIAKSDLDTLLYDIST